MWSAGGLQSLALQQYNPGEAFAPGSVHGGQSEKKPELKGELVGAQI